jgi:hypothetical protein
MTADAKLRASKPPRSLILSTGEETPNGHSVRARLLVLNLSNNQVKQPLLTKLQQDAEAGVFNKALDGFVRYLAQDYAGRLTAFDTRYRELRTEFSGTGHARTASIAADLQAAFELMLKYYVDSGLLSPQGAQHQSKAGHKASTVAVARQEDQQQDEEPTTKFFSLLRTGFSTNIAHVSARDGTSPDNPEAWGWKKWDQLKDDWEPKGICVAYIEGKDLFVDFDAAYSVAQRAARDSNQSLAISLQTLQRRLHERDYLLTTDIDRKGRYTYRVRRKLAGAERRVLHLSTAQFCRTVGLTVESSAEMGDDPFESV